ncbi:MAG: hypothetical protein ACXVMS_15805 [Flavisolibacter sp.]
MKQITRLYRDNPLVAFIFDAIALLVCAVSVIFVIAVLTVACASV